MRARVRSKKSIAIFTYKQRILSIEMKTKLVQHVESEWMRDWKSVKVRECERVRVSECESERVTFEPRHENKSCSACQKRVYERVKVFKVFQSFLSFHWKLWKFSKVSITLKLWNWGAIVLLKGGICGDGIFGRQVDWAEFPQPTEPPQFCGSYGEFNFWSPQASVPNR